MRSLFSDLIKLVGYTSAIVVFFTTKWGDCLHFMVQSRFLALSKEGVSIVPLAEVSFYILLTIVLMGLALVVGAWMHFRGYREWLSDFSLGVGAWLLIGVMLLYSLSLPRSWFQLVGILFFFYVYAWISLKVGWLMIKPS